MHVLDVVFGRPAGHQAAGFESVGIHTAAHEPAGAQDAQAAKATGVQGTVVVKFVVTETGGVTNIVVVRGDSVLADAAVAAIRTWVFDPALLQGKPIAVMRLVKFPFLLRPKSTIAPP